MKRFVRGRSFLKSEDINSCRLFFLAYVPWVCLALLKYTNYRKLFPIKDMLGSMRYIVILLLLLKFVYDRRYQRLYFSRNLAGIAVIGLCVLIEWHTEDTTVPIVLLSMFIFSAGNLKFDDILLVSFIIEVFVMAAALGGAYFGVIPNDIYGDAVRTRMALGFQFCTFGSHLMLFITMSYVCLRKRICFAECVLLLGINYILYRLTVTRVDIFIVAPFIAICYIWPLLSDKIPQNFFTKLLFQYGGILSVFFSVLAQKFYDPDIAWLAKINAALSSRLQLGHEAIQQYGIRLFGQQIRWVGVGSKTKHPDWDYNYVDCSYLKYLLNYGLVFLIILMLGMTWMGKQALEEQNQMLCVSYIALFLFAMVDAELCVLAFHPFLLSIGGFFWPNQQNTPGVRKEGCFLTGNRGYVTMSSMIG